jgi:succinyl-CoA synthetase alpha subunit
MSILFNRNNKVVVQGITGRAAGAHTRNMLKYGTTIVAGVSPGKGGTVCEGVPVVDTVIEAVEKYGADTAILFTPPLSSKEAIFETIEAGIKLIICVTEGIPDIDLMEITLRAKNAGARLIGPCSPGIIVPGEAKIGFLPERSCAKGDVGLVAKSGTLSYEIAYRLSTSGLGQSTWIGIGGEAMRGTSFVDLLDLFAEDDDTKAVVVLGEIGGNEEENVAAWVKAHPGCKPVISYIAGRTAPADKPMGHAGAIVSDGKGSYESKAEALRDAGVAVVENIADIPDAVKEALGRRDI